MRRLSRSALAVAVALVPACTKSAARPRPEAGAEARAIVMSYEQEAPLPLRVPIQGIMAGIVTDGALRIFASAEAEAPLTEEQWLNTGLAAINLVGASSVITLPGTGPDDARRTADPLYRRWASAMQAASIIAGSAAARQDRVDFIAAAERLAGACDGCHAVYRNELNSLPQYAGNPAGTAVVRP